MLRGLPRTNALGGDSGTQAAPWRPPRVPAPPVQPRPIAPPPLAARTPLPEAPPANLYDAYVRNKYHECR
jgi:hypothetical protein